MLFSSSEILLRFSLRSEIFSLEAKYCRMLLAFLNIFFIYIYWSFPYSYLLQYWAFLLLWTILALFRFVSHRTACWKFVWASILVSCFRSKTSCATIPQSWAGSGPPICGHPPPAPGWGCRGQCDPRQGSASHRESKRSIIITFSRTRPTVKSQILLSRKRPMNKEHQLQK